MSEQIRFKLTEAHVKLARAMIVRWQGNVEWGAPEIDPKRPYGNSDLYGDLIRIVGLPAVDEVPETLRDYLSGLHASMETALQVILTAGTFAPGEYVADRYHRNWRPA